MHRNHSAFLRRCPLLGDAREAARRALEESASEKVFDGDATVIEQDAHCPFLGLLRSGTLAAIKPNEAASHGWIGANCKPSSVERSVGRTRPLRGLK